MQPIEKKFRRERFSIILPVEKPSIPERINTVAHGYKLIEKPEHHVSVMVSANAQIAKEAVGQSNKPEELMEKIQSILDSLDWKYTLTDKYFLQENSYTGENMPALGYTDLPNHTRRTIIQKVDMPDMELFYEQMSKLLHISLDIPVPHITLFSWSDYPPMMTRGIGISSEKEFRSYLKEEL